MDLASLTAAVATRRNLSRAEASFAAATMANDQISDADKEAFLLTLAEKGETAEEVAGFASTYRALARKIDLGDTPSRAIDIVGTGGDKSGSFNISSTSALIVAAAGVPVVKHGNRSITSKSGSADFLVGLGVQLEAQDAKIKNALSATNFCYLYAPAFHPAFKAILNVRKKIAESGKRTVFNILGPLINPAQPACMMVGVYDERWVEPIAEALNQLGVKRGLVTHTQVVGGGMDEVTTAGPVRVRGCGELASVNATWLPGDFGFKLCTVEDLKGGSPEENLAMFSDLLVGGVSDGLMDTLCLSAGTALWVAGRVKDPSAGATLAREIILNGALRDQARRVREAYRD
jgi:anthranilate phosphoribosyltransferase